jgi:hypothetical protein
MTVAPDIGVVRLFECVVSSIYLRTEKFRVLSVGLQIRRPGFDSRHYQGEKKVVDLEWGSLSLVSTTEELLDRKVAAPV